MISCFKTQDALSPQRPSLSSLSEITKSPLRICNTLSHILQHNAVRIMAAKLIVLVHSDILSGRNKLPPGALPRQKLKFTFKKPTRGFR
ncbi:hypothetical protein XENOCAPTIV_025959, partial [Xenoophorus captivus]